MKNGGFIKHFLVILVIFLLGGCSRNAKNTEAQKGKLTDQNLSGTFEYTEPIEDSYLHFKIEMGQEGDSLKGRLWGGIYLAKVAEGYTTPNVTVECVLKGIIREDVIEMQLAVTKTDRLEEEAPELLGMMNFPELESKVAATTWGFTYENGSLVSQNGLLMPDGKTPVKFIWDKIK